MYNRVTIFNVPYTYMYDHIISRISFPWQPVVLWLQNLKTKLVSHYYIVIDKKLRFFFKKVIQDLSEQLKIMQFLVPIIQSGKG